MGKRPNAVRRRISNLRFFWLVGAGITALAVTENSARARVGFGLDIMPNTAAIPLLIAFTILTVLAATSRPEDPELFGFVYGFHGLFALAAIPYLLANAIVAMESPAAMLSEICILVVALSSFCSGDRRRNTIY